MLERLERAAARLMNRVRVNRVRQSVRGGVPVFIKRRRAGASILIGAANRLLALSGSGTCMPVPAAEWMAWEIYCFRLLYPERGGSRVDSAGQAVILPGLDGLPLRRMLSGSGTDARDALVLAARELRRAHALPCLHYRAGWSHGDLHLDNILCDGKRAFLVDFDIRHEFGTGQAQRQSGDLETVLLELIGRPEDRWQPLAEAFLEEYGEAAILGELYRRLRVPRGFARLLWYSRTNGAPLRLTSPRLESLREIIRHGLSAEV